MTPFRTWLTGDDLIALSARIAADLDRITGRVPSVALDFNRLMSGAPEAIGRKPWDFNADELDDLACMVIDAIAGRAEECPHGTACTRTHHPDHAGHDQWHVISNPGHVWCRTCQLDYVPGAA